MDRLSKYTQRAPWHHHQRERILTEEREIGRAVADKLDEGLPHRLAKRRVGRDYVGDGKEWEQHPWIHTI